MATRVGLSGPPRPRKVLSAKPPAARVGALALAATRTAKAAAVVVGLVSVTPVGADVAAPLVDGTARVLVAT